MPDVSHLNAGFLGHGSILMALFHDMLLPRRLCYVLMRCCHNTSFYVITKSLFSRPRVGTDRLVARSVQSPAYGRITHDANQAGLIACIASILSWSFSVSLSPQGAYHLAGEHRGFQGEKREQSVTRCPSLVTATLNDGPKDIYRTNRLPNERCGPGGGGSGFFSTTRCLFYPSRRFWDRLELWG